jgi:hypothetical protein
MAKKRSIISFLLFFLIFFYIAGVMENYTTDKHFHRWADTYIMEVPESYFGFTSEGEEIAREYLFYLEDIYNGIETDVFSWVPYRSDYLYPRRSNFISLLHAVVGDALFGKTELVKVEPLDKVKNIENFEEELKEKYLANIDKYYERPSLNYIDPMVPEIIDEKLVYEFYINTQSNLKAHMDEGEYIKAFADYNILKSLDDYLKSYEEEITPSVEYIRLFVTDLKISLPLAISTWLIYIVYKMTKKNYKEVDK